MCRARIPNLPNRSMIGIDPAAIGLVRCTSMKIRATFLKDGRWWVAWTEDVPGAMTQGRTRKEARENLLDAIRIMQEPLDLDRLPKREIVVEELDV